MGYTLPQIAVILAKADRTMYKIGAIAYDDMFNQLDESLDYDRDIIYIYKVAVEYADNFYVGTDKLDTVVERLGAKVAVYDFGQLTPIYSDSTIVTQVVPVGAALDDLSDVTITNVQNNQTLRYSSSLGQWVNVGPGAATRNRQQFTATLNQTVFVTSFQFESGLLDVYLNGVKLSPPSYTTFGNYTITLADGSLADDIVEVIAYAPETSFIDLSGYVPTSRTLTINGVTYDLSANRSWTVSGGVPYTGAIADVDLGEFGIRAGQFTLDTSPTGTAVVGTTRWNDTIGSSETTLKGGSVILKNGVDLVARVVNKVFPNATLTKAAYQAVRVSGAQGQRLAVAYAQANNDANSADTIGLVTETIPTNQEGFIITVGQIENINTTGSLQGETWVDGDVLYLSPFTPGAITKVKPTGNGHIVIIGYVEYAHVNNGKIYVKVMNGWELDELHDVSIVSPANNEALIYESSTALWKNKTIATALGYTPISGTGASGQVAYWNGTNSQTGSSTLTYSPTTSLLVNNSVTAATAIARGTNLTPTLTASANSDVLVGLDVNPAFTNGAFTGVSNIGLRVLGNIAETYPAILIRNTSALSGATTVFRAQDNSTGVCEFGTGSTGGVFSNIAYFYTNKSILDFYANAGNRMRIYGSTGNVVLQNGGTFTDAGYRLDVNGTARVSGQITSAITADAFNRVMVSNTTSGTSSFVVFSATSDASAGEFQFGKYSTSKNSFAGINAKDGFIYNSTGGDIAISNAAATGTIKLFAGGITTAQATLTAAGRLLLGTTTESTFLLDVNGTARVSGQVTGNSFVPTSSTIPTNGLYLPSANTLGFASGTSARMVITSTGAVGIGTTSPTGLFEVKGDGASYFTKGTKSILLNPNVVGADTNALIETSSGMGLAFGTNGAERMRLDSSGNLGLGVQPSAWSGLSGKVFEFGTAFGDKGSIFQNDVDDLRLMSNVYFNGSFRYVRTGTATIFHSNNGSYKWNIAPSGTAGNAITFTQAMTLTANGRLLLGTTTEGTEMLQVNGTIKADGRIFINAGNGNQLYLNNAGERYTQIIFDNNSTSVSQAYLAWDSVANFFEMYAKIGGGLKFYANQSEAMCITTSSFVGIGTSTPSYKLDVNRSSLGAIAQFITLDGTYNPRLLINGTSEGIQLFATYSSGGAEALMFGTANTERMRLTSNLIIGSTVDSGERLQVSGSVKATSFIKSGGTSSQYLMADGSVTTGGGLISTNRQTASYTLALTDADKLVEMNVATANNLTVPLNSSVAFAIGTKIDLSQYGAGQTTVVATSGVTVRSAGGALKLAVQYSGGSLVKIGTDEWYLFGDITV